MQSSSKRFFLSVAMLATLVTTLSIAHAASPSSKTYSEDEFLNNFSGKSSKVITSKLGQPFKKEMSVKPTGANTMMMKAGATENNSKPVKVEMWYYKNIVRYDPKRTYKETEITLVNDKAMNIAFFNNR
ncbi:MAG: hypothetical protein FJY53_06940 [Betaproteobacteria bacterium]|nr:hypothetical protein [Betaproteobacteria bacterium]